MSHVEGDIGKTLAVSRVSVEAAVRWTMERHTNGGDGKTPPDERYEVPKVETVVVSEESSEPESPPRMDGIDAVWFAVNNVLKVTRDEVRSRSRHPVVVLARGMVAYYIRVRFGMSYPDIGREVNTKSHVSVMEGYKRTAERILAKKRVYYLGLIDTRYDVVATKMERMIDRLIVTERAA